MPRPTRQRQKILASKRPTPAHFARLLRIDRYRAAPRPPGWTEAAFERAWWLLSGRVELSRGSPVSSADIEWLLQDVDGWPVLDGLTMNQALWFAWHTRSELQKSHPLQTRQDFKNLLCWFWSDGMRELQLAADLPDAFIERLNAPSGPDFWPYPTPIAESPPLLMAIALHSRPELRTVFRLNSTEGVQQAWLWFLTAGAQRLGVTPVLSDRWSEWCEEPAPTGPYALDVPRLASLKWRCDTQMQNEYPLTDFSSQQTLLEWYAQVQQNETDWSWHLQSLSQRRASWNKRFGTYTVYPPAGGVFGVNLIGFAKGELGIGEDIRTAARTLELAGIPHSVINIFPGVGVRQADNSLEHKMAEQSAATAPYPINIFCLTGFDTARVFVQQGPSLFEGRYNIGWWPWELPVWPTNWSSAFDLIDEIWAASRFNVEMYAKASRKPVTRMPLNFHVTKPHPRSRRSFGLPAKAFTFLFIFDGNSYPRRKNPMAVIDAFQRAFHTGDKRVALALKTMNAKPDNPDWQQFMAACEVDNRIHLIDETLDKRDVNALISVCDAYVSLHRSEGYGRTLAEAMLLGKPVVASQWSGNADFLTDETGYPVRGQLIDVQPGDYPFIAKEDTAQWFSADIDHAAEQMQQVFRDSANDPDAITRKVAAGVCILNSAAQFLVERLAALRDSKP